MLTYKQKVIEALEKARTLEDFDYIEQKIRTTDKINRRTILGREQTDELIGLVWDKRNEAITQFNLVPFT